MANNENSRKAMLSALFNKITFNEWLAIGIEENWCGPAVCYTHDGLPMSITEEEEMCESDPCLHIVRLYEDELIKQQIEENHSPSQWRKNNK